jgi:hypothetical protein
LEMGVSWTIIQDLLISVCQLARFTGTSHLCLAMFCSWKVNKMGIQELGWLNISSPPSPALVVVSHSLLSLGLEIAPRGALNLLSCHFLFSALLLKVSKPVHMLVAYSPSQGMRLEPSLTGVGRGWASNPDVVFGSLTGLWL